MMKELDLDLMSRAVEKCQRRYPVRDTGGSPPVISAAQETKIEGLQFEASLGKKVV
jgi:hypothetical protein